MKHILTTSAFAMVAAIAVPANAESPFDGLSVGIHAGSGTATRSGDFLWGRLLGRA